MQPPCVQSTGEPVCRYETVRAMRQPLCTLCRYYWARRQGERGREGERERESKHLVVAERAGLGSEGVTSIVPADALVTRLRATGIRKAREKQPSVRRSLPEPVAHGEAAGLAPEGLCVPRASPRPLRTHPPHTLRPLPPPPPPPATQSAASPRLLVRRCVVVVVAAAGSAAAAALLVARRCRLRRSEGSGEDSKTTISKYSSAHSRNHS